MEGPSFKAVATARRNLLQRIEKLIVLIEKDGREPTPWEAHYTSLALDDLEEQRFAQGETTMAMAAEEKIFNTPVSPRPLPADARKAKVAALRKRWASLAAPTPAASNP